MNDFKTVFDISFIEKEWLPFSILLFIVVAIIFITTFLVYKTLKENSEINDK